MTSTPALEQCVILVGGLGTRLGSLAGGLPKPLASVGGRPFLSYLLWHVRRFGLKRVLLLAGHLCEAVTAFAADPQWTHGLAVEVVVEPQPLGTGGALRHAASRLDEQFLLLNGDSVFDFNWLDLSSLAAALPDAEAVMGLRREADASRFGVVTLTGDRVTGFRERGDATGGAINGGVYLMRRTVAEACPEHSSFERDVLPALAARGGLAGRLENGFFIDIGVPDALANAQSLVPASLTRGAVFFDRDGVLNVDRGYTHRWEEFEWIEGAVEAVKAVNDRNLFAFLITNQSGVARGYYEASAVDELHERMQEALRSHGAHLDDIRYCPHHPEGVVQALAKACDWRKPRPGMIADLVLHWPVDMARSRLVGDNATDIQAANAAGIPGALHQSGPLSDTVAAVLASIE